MTTQIIQGDSLEVLKSLNPESVNCVITSPPYYGLRDYGTGTWEGGDPDYDEAIIGVTINGRVVYDFNKMINHLVKKEDMSEEEAMDFISYNTIRAGEYIDNAPIILEARIEDLT